MATTTNGSQKHDSSAAHASAGSKLPTLGAAMMLEHVPHHLEWLADAARPLELQDAFIPDVLDSTWREVARHVRTLLDGYPGLYGIHGPFIDLPLNAADPRICEVVSLRLRQGLDFAQEVGATHMVVHSPFKFFGSPFVPHSPAFGLAHDLERVHAILDPLLPLAEAANCTFVIENIHDTNSAPLLALVRSFNSSRVRMSLDTGHAFIKHQIGGPTPDQWAADAGELLGHVHLTDTDGQYDRHWMPGRGRINWYALFEALRKSPATPRLIVEINSPEEIPHAAQWLANQGLAQ